MNKMFKKLINKIKCYFKIDKWATDFTPCENCPKKLKYMGYGVWVEDV